MTKVTKRRRCGRSTPKKLSMKLPVWGAIGDKMANTTKVFPIKNEAWEVLSNEDGSGIIIHAEGSTINFKSEDELRQLYYLLVDRFNDARYSK